VKNAVPLVIMLPDEAATGVLAAALAGLARSGDVIGLSGPLGSGKTSFARAFIRARLDAADVPSPTFTLVETYEPENGPAIWHFDLYRLKTPEEAWELGLEEAYAGGIALIEWPERLGGDLPRERLDIGLAGGATEGSRVATLIPSTHWADRVASLDRG
jgi:tRNA threonylcarbamoyladenosine biosynthesis protein TsaE